MTTAADYQQLQAMRELPPLASCTGTRVLWSGAAVGIGSQLHSMVDSLTHALSMGASFDTEATCFRRRSPWLQCAPNATGTATQNPCAARRRDGPAGRRTCLACYFVPLARCNRTASADDVTLERNQANFSFAAVEPWRSVAPLARGVFWAYATLASRLLRPNAALQASAERAAARHLRWGAGQPYLGLQMRTGDKKIEAPVHATDEYLSAVLHMARVTGVRNVFVSGSLSDAEKRDTVCAPAERAGLLCAYVPATEAAAYGCPASAIMGFLVDVLLLRDADALVGTLSSNVGRLAYELSAARLGRLPTFHDMDNAFWYAAGDGFATSDIYNKVYGRGVHGAAAQGRGGGAEWKHVELR